MFPLSSLWDASFAIVVAILILYTCYGAVHRLYFSPIARFPGPKLAALTFWYEFYYDVYKRGKYTWKIKELHDEYGPVVRINPFELHFNDPEFYDVLYCGPSQRRDKWKWSARLFGIAETAFATIDHYHHRQRRAVINPYFSKKSVTQLEPMIQSIIANLCSILETYQKSGEPLLMEYAYSALTADVISTYAFRKSYGCVTPGFAPEWYHMVSVPSELSHSLKQFPWLFPLLQSLPLWLVRITNPPVYKLLMIQEGFGKQIQEIQEIQDSHENKDDAHVSHRTIFHEILTSDMPASEKTARRMIDEAQAMIGAGTITTAHMLKVTSYHILANPKILQGLKSELKSVMPDSMKQVSSAQLQQLPYFTAIVNEGLRLSYGVSQRLPRIAPDRVLKYHDWEVPAGTPMSMTSVLMHDDPNIWPEPNEFRPERWLEDGQRLDKYLVPFSKGTRNCAGQNLAYAEIYLALAAVFRRFEFELYETTRHDVDIVRDFFNTSAELDSKGLRVKVMSFN